MKTDRSIVRMVLISIVGIYSYVLCGDEVKAVSAGNVPGTTKG